MQPRAVYVQFQTQTAEEAFGWIKAAGLRRTKHRGRPWVAGQFVLATCAYNLIRPPKLLALMPT